MTTTGNPMDREAVKRLRAQRKEERLRKKNAGRKKRGVMNTITALADKKPKRPVQ